MKTAVRIAVALVLALGGASFAEAQDNDRIEAMLAEQRDRFIANANRLAGEANAAADAAEAAAREAKAFPTCVGDARRTIRTLAGTEETCVNSFLANDQAVERAARAAGRARALANQVAEMVYTVAQRGGDELLARASEVHAAAESARAEWGPAIMARFNEIEAAQR